MIIRRLFPSFFRALCLYLFAFSRYGDVKRRITPISPRRQKNESTIRGFNMALDCGSCVFGFHAESDGAGQDTESRESSESPKGGQERRKNEYSRHRSEY